MQIIFWMTREVSTPSELKKQDILFPMEDLQLGFEHELHWG